MKNAMVSKGIAMGMMDGVYDSKSSELGDGSIDAPDIEAVIVVRSVNHSDDEPQGIRQRRRVSAGPNAHINTAAAEGIGLELALLNGKALPAGNPKVDSAASMAIASIHAGIPANSGKSQKHLKGIRIRRGKHAHQQPVPAAAHAA